MRQTDFTWDKMLLHSKLQNRVMLNPVTEYNEERTSGVTVLSMTVLINVGGPFLKPGLG